MSRATVLPLQERLPASDAGVDWGAPRRVLVRTADRKVSLFIREGHNRSGGAWGFGSQYEPTALILQVGSYLNGRTLHLAQGRVTKAVLKQHAVEISHRMGSDAWAPLADPKCTVVIEP